MKCFHLLSMRFSIFCHTNHCRVKHWVVLIIHDTVKRHVGQFNWLNYWKTFVLVASTSAKKRWVLKMLIALKLTATRDKSSVIVAQFTSAWLVIAAVPNYFYPWDYLRIVIGMVVALQSTSSLGNRSCRHKLRYFRGIFLLSYGKKIFQVHQSILVKEPNEPARGRYFYAST